MSKQVLEPKHKALSINLDNTIYGSFAEIGAGQEVVRHFFQAGGAAGTVAKTMSAYDMTFSDVIYGKTKSGRYVTNNRLEKMLDHEYELLEERLRENRPDTKFFVFADTVSALNYKKNNRCHGWLGIRFQLAPNRKPNDVILHIKMLDNQNLLQQKAIGTLGLNLIHACYNHYRKPEDFLHALMDHLSNDRIKIDTINVSGPDFEFDNRLLSLMLVRFGYSDAAMFKPDGMNIQPSEHLYKKSIAVLRGRFRPVTNVHLDILEKGIKQFEANKIDDSETVLLTEISLANLTIDRDDGIIQEQDFLSRVDILCGLGNTVLITSCDRNYQLVEYLEAFRPRKIGLLLGCNNFIKIMNPETYKYLAGGLLEACGRLFLNSVQLLVFPFLDEGKVFTLQNFEIEKKYKHLYTYLMENKSIVDIEDVDVSKLAIYSDDVIKLLKDGQPEWECMVPPIVVEMVKEKCLFDYPCVNINDNKPKISPNTPLV